MSTALVPAAVGEYSMAPGAAVGRPRADFLAQLIASATRAPQMRLRRRAEPAEAVAAYAVIERGAAAHRPALSRSL